MIEADLFVGGCGRSGTTYLARCFREAGFQVPHEKLGSQGTVSWYFVPKVWGDLRPPFNKGTSKQHKTGEAPQTTTFKHQIHMVREPLKVIGSAPGIFTNKDWQFIGAHCPWVTQVAAPNAKTKRIIMAARYWCAWNRLMEERDPEFRMRLDEVPARWATLAGILGNADAPFPAHVSTKTNGNATGWRAAVTVSWADLKSLDLGTFWKVRDLAHEYGFDTE